MRNIALIAAVAAAFTTTCDLAVAARPVAGKTYGGGTIGSRYVSNNHNDVNLVTIGVSGDRNSVKVVGQVNHRCSSTLPPNTNVFFTLKGKLRRNGTFSVSGPISAPGPDGTEDGTGKASGRFTGPGRVIGTISASTTVKLNSGAQGTCTTGNVHFEADLPGARGESGVARSHAAYFGEARIGGPVPVIPALIRLAASSRKVAQFAIPFVAKCASGKTLQQTEIMPGGSVSGRGAFALSEKFSAPLQPGITSDVTASAKGSFGRRMVSGTFRLVAIVKDASGKQLDTCDTGTVRWKAAR